MFKRIGTIWLVVALLFAGIFVIGGVVGWWFPTAWKLPIVSGVIGKFEAILAQSETSGLLAVNIFLNNLVVALIVLIAGIIPFLSIVIVFGNGVIIGIFFDLLWRLHYVEPGNFMSAVIGLLPHGLFELSAIFLAGSLGTVALIKLLFPQALQPQQARLQFLALTSQWFGLIVVPLLVVAAVVEAFISPRVTHVIQQWQDSQPATSAVAVTLDGVALAQTGCLPDNTVTSMNTAAMDYFYNPTVYQLLKIRAQSQSWTETYTCDDGETISIAAYEKTLWSADQAQQLIDQAATDSGVVYTVYTTADKTIVIAQTNPQVNVLDLIPEIRYSL